VTISETNRRLIEATCGGAVANLVVLHVGIDGTRFRPNEASNPDASTMPGDSPDAAGPVPGASAASGACPRIVCVGTLHEVKGQRHLIGAARRLAERGIAFELLFVGDGEDRADLETLATSVPQPGVIRFLGQQTRDEIVQLLRTVDLLVTPSVPTASGKREGLPVVLIEAMASGVAVVASHLSGIPELVEDGVTGRTVPPGDEDALADAIQSVLADPARRRELGAAGRGRVEAEFDLDRNAIRLVALFAGAAT
jgi:colanic acid/amylovoran biosynthesis glycosyltransferase